jgi:hypothetical protein
VHPNNVATTSPKLRKMATNSPKKKGIAKKLVPRKPNTN